MEIFGFDIAAIFTLENIFFILIGSFVGLLIGALPGMGTNLAIVMMLPLSFTMDALTAVLMLLCVYQCAEYGGSISAITLGIPGTASAAASQIDGNAMAKKGQPGRALRLSLMSSMIGGFFGALVLMFLTQPVGQFSLRFSAPDFFMLGVTALIAVVSLNSQSMIKGLVSLCIGLMFSMVGTDVFTGAARYTFGRTELLSGVYTVGLVVAVFAVPEVLDIITQTLHTRYAANTKNLNARLSAKDWKDMIKPAGLGSVVGTVIGIFPGLGAAISAWMALLLEKKTMKNPDPPFGEGNPGGITAPEAANNACVAGSMVPMLSLGIPGSSAAAIIGAAFIVHGVQVGPSLFNTEPELLNGIYFGFMLSPIAMLVLGLLLTPFFARVVTIPNALLVPILIFLILTGTYVGNRYFFHLWFALIVGVGLYFMKKADFPLPPLIIAFVLGPIIEENYRRAFDLSQGKVSIFWQSTTSKVILVALVIIILFPIVKNTYNFIKRKKGGKTFDLPEEDG